MEWATWQYAHITITRYYLKPGGGIEPQNHLIFAIFESVYVYFFKTIITKCDRLHILYLVRFKMQKIKCDKMQQKIINIQQSQKMEQKYNTAKIIF